MKKKKIMINNNGIALLLVMNVIFLIANTVTHAFNDESEKIVYASSSNDLNIEDKRKVSEIEDGLQEYDVTYVIESVTDLSESNSQNQVAEMFFSHTDDKGTYFTYMKTSEAKKFIGGYWYVPFDVLEKGGYIPQQLKHNDRLEAMFFSNYDKGYFKLKPLSETNSCLQK